VLVKRSGLMGQHSLDTVALAERFSATLERQLLNRHRFRSKAKSGWPSFKYIEGWQSPGRRHLSLGYRPRVNYESAHQRSAA
jgi:hypothetical protein